MADLDADFLNLISNICDGTNIGASETENCLVSPSIDMFMCKEDFNTELPIDLFSSLNSNQLTKMQKVESTELNFSTPSESGSEHRNRKCLDTSTEKTTEVAFSGEFIIMTIYGCVSF